MNMSSSTEVQSGPALDERSFSVFLSNLITLDFAGVILFLAIASVTISTHFVFPDVSVAGMGISTIHNGFMLGAFALYGLVHGFKLFVNPVIAGYTLLLLTTFTVASFYSNLTTLQPFKSYFSLMLGVLVLHLMLTDQFRHVGIRLIVLLAPISLVIGVVFHAAGIHEIYAYEELTSGVYRLQGAAIPAHLASLAQMGMLAAFTLAHKQRLFAWLGLLNFAIIAATVTRLDFATGFIFIGIFIWPIIKHTWTERNFRYLSGLAIGAVLVGIISMFTLPNVLSRSSYGQNEVIRFLRISHTNEMWIEAVQTEDIPPNCPTRRDGRVRVNCLERKAQDKAIKALDMVLYHGFVPPVNARDQAAQDTNEDLLINTSGRLDAWRIYWDVAEENLVFGRGLGTGTVVSEVTDTTFEVPHNEYLRLIVDGGFVALFIMLGAYGYLFYRSFKRQREPYDRLMMGAAIGLFVLLAFFDNPLIAKQISIPFWLYVAIQTE